MTNSIGIKRVPPFFWNSRGLEVLHFKKKMENVVKLSMYNRFFMENILKATHGLKYTYGVYIKGCSQKSPCNIKDISVLESSCNCDLVKPNYFLRALWNSPLHEYLLSFLTGAISTGSALE